MATKTHSGSDAIVARLQQIQRERDRLRGEAHQLNADLELALIAEGKAVSNLATADLRNPDVRAAIRAQLDALED